MALTTQQWQSWQQHIDLVAGDCGQWVGLLDEHAQPIFTCPTPVSIQAPKTRGAMVSGMALFEVVTDDGAIHPLVDELISDAWGSVDNTGELVPYHGPSRYLVSQRAGRPRRTFKVTHSRLTIQGGRPTMIEVHGECLNSKLNRIPLFSDPHSINGEFTTFSRDWVGEETQGSVFDTPRDIQGMNLVTVADGVTLDGPAESVIRRAITRSLETAFKAAGKPQTIVVSPVGSGLESPYMAFTMNDGYLWDSLGGLALQAGVLIDTSLWLPFDPPPAGLDASTYPMIVVTVTQSKEVTV